MMFQVLKQIEGDETLLHDLTAKPSVKELTVSEASIVIAQLLAIKRGEAALTYDSNGKAKVTSQ
jgi:hypothetical protein